MKGERYVWWKKIHLSLCLINRCIGAIPKLPINMQCSAPERSNTIETNDGSGISGGYNSGAEKKTFQQKTIQFHNRLPILLLFMERKNKLLLHSQSSKMWVLREELLYGYERVLLIEFDGSFH